MQIKIDDLTGPAITELLEEHLENMAENSPPESMHALGFKECTPFADYIEDPNSLLMTKEL